MSRTTAHLAIIATIGFAAAAEAATVSISLNQIARGVANKNGLLGTFDLTQGGEAIDWVKAGGRTASPYPLVGAEKDAASVLSVTSPGISIYTSYADDGYKLTWSGGDATMPAGATGLATDGKTYVGVRSSTNLAGNDVGFRTIFSAPAAGDYRLTIYAAATDPAPFDLSATSWVSSALSGSALANRVAGPRVNSGDVDEFIWTVDIVNASAGESLALDLFHVNNTTSSIMALTGASVVAVPEPAMAGLVLISLAGLAARRSRRSH